MDNEMIAKLNALLAEEFEIEESAITPEASLKQTLMLDSLSLVDLVAVIEGEFGVKIDNKEIPSIKTFADLYNYIDSHK